MLLDHLEGPRTSFSPNPLVRNTRTTHEPTLSLFSPRSISQRHLLRLRCAGIAARLYLAGMWFSYGRLLCFREDWSPVDEEGCGEGPFGEKRDDDSR